MHGDQKKDTIHGFQILPSLWGHFVQTWKYHNLECLNLSKQPNLIAKLWPKTSLTTNYYLQLEYARKTILVFKISSIKRTAI